MKKYKIDDLRVVKIESKNEVRYTICLFRRFTKTYIDIFTKEIIVPTSKVETLNSYYNLAELYYRKDERNRSIKITIKELLEKYYEINELKKQESKKEITPKEVKANIKKDETKEAVPSTTLNITQILEKATDNFFPKKGDWYSDCFERSKNLYMLYLPCNLRDSRWLAKMLQRNQNLDRINYYDILEFVSNSKYFNEARHNYELEIVKWQIDFIRLGGEGWICDDNYGGDAMIFSSVCDLGFRKAVLDTLLAIGMDQEVIEEGLERFADLWRERFMSSAFNNEYAPFFYLANPEVYLEPVSEEHKTNWVKYRKYEYYKRHKQAVDKYGIPDEDMLISEEEALALEYYLNQKHTERKQQIEEYKKEAYGKGRTRRL